MTTPPNPGPSWELLEEGTFLAEDDELWFEPFGKWLKFDERPRPFKGDHVTARVYHWRRRIAPKPVEEGAHGPWRIEYDNDTGSSADCFHEWWNVTDGPHSFECPSEHEAQYLRDSLNSHASLVRRNEELAGALDTLSMVVGLTPIAGNKEALQEAMNQARAALANNAKGGDS